VIALDPVVQILGLPMFQLRQITPSLFSSAVASPEAALLSVLVTCGIQSRLRFKAAARKRPATLALRRSASKNQGGAVLDERTERYFQWPFTRT
jgi:hypothetical protein